MLKNYFKIAWRNLLKSKAYSAINIVGLASGMAVIILIGLWIWDEVSFDQYHKNHSRVAQVMTTQTFNGETGTGRAVAMPLGNELREKYSSDFKHISMASWNSDHVLGVGDKKITAAGMWVETDFPKMFTLNILKGSLSGLKDPTSVMLNSSVATSLFGDEDPLNKLVRIDNKDSYKVVAVYEDIPYNTSLRDTKILLPWSKYSADGKRAMTQWGNHSYQAYVQINDHVNFGSATRKIKDASMKHLNAAEDGKEELVLQPMDNWHLYSEFKNGKVVGGRIQFVWLFGIIGVFVLLLACINFMNLSTARSEKRSKEVGIRKTVGSSRQQLIVQFLAESIVVAFLALVLSIIMVLLMLPFFNGLADKQIHLPGANPIFWMMLLVFTFFTGIVSGSYPAFYLSAFNPIAVLKGTFKVGRYASLPRKILVVIQFTISITLIIGTIIVYKQIQFAKDRPVGYTREGLITVGINTPDLRGHYDALRNDLLATGVVENMAESSSPSTDIWSNQIGFSWEGKDPTTLPLFGTISVTQDFGKTIGWQIKEGRDFSRDFSTDTSALILNEAAVKLTALKDIVNKTIRWNDRNYTVIGVVNDMVMRSPYEPVVPIIFTMDPEWVNVITVRIKPSVTKTEAFAKIGGIFKKYDPESPFEYKFNDTEYEKKFSNEVRIGNLSTFFAVLAILISCLGLFGLASFVAEQRTKEIGIRKVLGASISTLWKMLSKDFMVLVIISSLIAVPISYYYTHSWLQNYKYRTDISWWIFAIAAGGALIITLLTVSFQAVKAAMANPSKSLKAE